MKTVRVVCAHDCPDMCSLLAHVEGDRVIRVQGDPDQPYTAGFACAKVPRASATGSAGLAGSNGVALNMASILCFPSLIVVLSPI